MTTPQLQKLWNEHRPRRGHVWTQFELAIAMTLEKESRTTRYWMKQSRRSQRFVERVALLLSPSQGTLPGTEGVQKSPSKTGTSDSRGYKSGTPEGTEKRTQPDWAYAAADRLMHHVKDVKGVNKKALPKSREAWARQIASLDHVGLDQILRAIDWIFDENLLAEYPFVILSGLALVQKFPRVLTMMERGNGAVRKKNAKAKPPSKSSLDQQKALEENRRTVELDRLEHEHHIKPKKGCVRCEIALKKQGAQGNLCID